MKKRFSMYILQGISVLAIASVIISFYSKGKDIPNAVEEIYYHPIQEEGLAGIELVLTTPPSVEIPYTIDKDAILPPELDAPSELESEQWISLGEFEVTAYCNDEICCGKWAGGPTKSGLMPTIGHTVAVDTEIIPLESVILVNGQKYYAEDTGSAVIGNIIDIYMETHEEAVEFGRQKAEVFIKE